MYYSRAKVSLKPTQMDPRSSNSCLSVSTMPCPALIFLSSTNSQRFSLSVCIQCSSVLFCSNSSSEHKFQSSISAWRQNYSLQWYLRQYDCPQKPQSQYGVPSTFWAFLEWHTSHQMRGRGHDLLWSLLYLSLVGRYWIRIVQYSPFKVHLP